MIDFESPLFIRLATKRSVVLERMLSTPSHFRPESIRFAEYILEKRKESPDYDSYSLYDLIDARNHINEEKFPVRTHYLDLQISARKRHDYSSSNEERNKAQKDAIRINPRLSVSIKKGGSKIEEEIEISLDDFKDYLIDPQYNEYIVIEDSSIKLFVQFDFDKNRHGFFFSYYDKYEQKTFDSTVHGISKNFTLPFLKNFLEKGKSELKQIEWKTLKKGSFISLILSILFLVFFIGVPLALKYEVLVLSDFISTHLTKIKTVVIYLFLGLLAVNVFNDRKQFKYFSRLTLKEKFDTIFQVIILIVLIVLILFGKFDPLSIIMRKG